MNATFTSAQHRLRIAPWALCAGGDHITDQVWLDRAMTTGRQTNDAGSPGQMAAR